MVLAGAFLGARGSGLLLPPLLMPPMLSAPGFSATSPK